MLPKPQGFPFLFYGREPAAEHLDELRYAVELAAPIAFASRAEVALDQAFRAAVGKDATCTARLAFDPEAPTRLVASVEPASALAPEAAAKLVVRGLLVIHGSAPIVECVHLASGGRGSSAWDLRSREARPEPSRELLAFRASTPPGDPSLAAAPPPQQTEPEPVIELRPLRTIPARPVAAVLAEPDAWLARALENGSVALSEDGLRAAWFEAGLVLGRGEPGAPTRVLADLGSLPVKIAGPWAGVAIVDRARLLVASRGLVLFCAESRGLFRPVSAVSVPVAVHDAAASGGLAFVGSASDTSPVATLHVLRIAGHALSLLARVPVGGDLWKKSSDVARLLPAAIGDRLAVTARFASKGRMLKGEAHAEIVVPPTIERGAPPSNAEPAGDDAIPTGASEARPLPGGGAIALVPTLEPVRDTRTVVPFRRRVLRFAPDGTPHEYALPVGGYTSLALSPDGARFAVCAAHGHGEQRLVVDVASGEVLSAREATGDCLVFLDEERLLVGPMVERWKDGASLERLAIRPWAAAVERATGTLFVLEIDGSIARFSVGSSGAALVGRAGGAGPAPAAIRQHAGRVEQRVDATWSPLR